MCVRAIEPLSVYSLMDQTDAGASEASPMSMVCARPQEVDNKEELPAPGALVDFNASGDERTWSKKRRRMSSNDETDGAKCEEGVGIFSAPFILAGASFRKSRSLKYLGVGNPRRPTLIRFSEMAVK